MKRLLFLFSILTTYTAFSQQKIDTLHVADNKLQSKWLREGNNQYLVFFEDSSGRKTGFSMWERNLAFTKFNGEDVIHITQEWHATDSMGRRKVTSLVNRKNFEPVYHRTWSPRSGVQAFSFSNKNITGIDTVVESTNKDFNVALNEATLNWELDLETFSTLPLKEGKAFALNFYHPGSKTEPQFYLYTVTGSEKLNMLNGEKMDCWKLEIQYNKSGSSRATFYISKKTHDVLKMIEHFGKGKRYKVKLGVVA